VHTHYTDFRYPDNGHWGTYHLIGHEEWSCYKRCHGCNKVCRECIEDGDPNTKSYGYCSQRCHDEVVAKVKRREGEENTCPKCGQKDAWILSDLLSNKWNIGTQTYLSTHRYYKCKKCGHIREEHHSGETWESFKRNAPPLPKYPPPGEWGGW